MEGQNVHTGAEMGLKTTPATQDRSSPGSPHLKPSGRWDFSTYGTAMGRTGGVRCRFGARVVSTDPNPTVASLARGAWSISAKLPRVCSTRSATIFLSFSVVASEGQAVNWYRRTRIFEECVKKRKQLLEGVHGLLVST